MGAEVIAWIVVLILAILVLLYGLCKVAKAADEDMEQIMRDVRRKQK